VQAAKSANASEWKYLFCCAGAIREMVVVQDDWAEWQVIHSLGQIIDAECAESFVYIIEAARAKQGSSFEWVHSPCVKIHPRSMTDGSRCSVFQSARFEGSRSEMIGKLVCLAAINSKAISHCAEARKAFHRLI